jgi:MFS family permease
MFGNLISGQISDLFGRKRPMFMSIVIMMAANLLGFFSTCWEMFAAAAFFIGVGGGFFLTTHYCLLSEFSPAKWRVWITGFPSWPMQGCLFSLVSWLLHDWRCIQLVTAIIALPFLLSWL